MLDEGPSDRALGEATGNALRMQVSAKRRGCRATPARQRQNTPHGTARRPACETRNLVGVVSPAITQLPFLSCAQALSRPEGPAELGGGAQRLVRRRAQRQAVSRDGRQFG